MRSVRAVQQNNCFCDNDQIECVSTVSNKCADFDLKDSRFEKLLKNNFFIDTFQDLRSQLQKNSIVVQIFEERLFQLNISQQLFFTNLFRLFIFHFTFHISSTMGSLNSSAVLFFPVLQRLYVL